MVKVKVQVQILCIDVVPGEPVFYRVGDIFECPEERATKLGNSVIILPEQKPETEPEPKPDPEPPEIEPPKPPVIQPNKKRR